LGKSKTYFHKTTFTLHILIFWGFATVFAQITPSESDTTKNGKGIKPKSLLNTNLPDTIPAISSNRWVAELQNIVIRPPKSEITDTLATSRTDLEFLEYEGLIIRNIRFLKMEVFGTDIQDTLAQAKTWIEKSANSMHVKTNDRILERHLLFKINDPIDPQILADNVRLFRDLNYVEDARIIVNPIEQLEGYADILVIIKDQWSMAFYLQMDELNSGHIELWDKNLFGTGNEIQNNIHWNPEKSDFWGYEAIYNNRNILGSFIDSKLSYSNVFDSKAYGVQFNRKFFTPNTKYAGGASAFHQSSIKNVFNEDSGFISQNISTNNSDIWIGRAFKLNENAVIGKNRLNLILASRVFKENFFDRPEVSANNYYDYQDKTVWLTTLALSSQSFYQSSLIYSYGRTEDIPIGSLLNTTVGPEFGEFENRMYTSISFAKGDFITNLGYLYFKVSEGGFIANSGNFEQAMFQIKVKYFSNLLIFGQFKFRQFINFDFTKGVKRFENERLTINDKYGLRGFSEENVYGQQRFVMNMETVAFSPWYIYGFRFSFYSYVDFGMIGPESVNLLYEDVYSGLGFGVRIQNERLVFPTFSFRFGIYPNLPFVPYVDRMQFSGEPRLNPNNFYQTYPDMIDFR